MGYGTLKIPLKRQKSCIFEWFYMHFSWIFHGFSWFFVYPKLCIFHRFLLCPTHAKSSQKHRIYTGFWPIFDPFLAIFSMVLGPSYGQICHFNGLIGSTTPQNPPQKSENMDFEWFCMDFSCSNIRFLSFLVIFGHFWHLPYAYIRIWLLE